MKGQLKVATPAQYIAKLKEPRKAEVAALDRLIRKTTKLKPFIQIGILAYGHRRLKYADGREVDWFRVGVASNASYISLYVSGASRHKKALPKANITGGCVRFKRMSDLDHAALAKMIREGAKAAGKL